MNNAKSIESGNCHQLVISNKGEFDALGKRFFELNVLYAVRNNLNMAIELVQQNGLYMKN